MYRIFIAAVIIVLAGVIAFPLISSSKHPGLNNHHGYTNRNFPIAYIYPDYEKNKQAWERNEQSERLYSSYYNESLELKNQLLAKEKEIQNLITTRHHPDIKKLESIKGEITDIWTKLTQLSIDLQYEEQKINSNI